MSLSALASEAAMRAALWTVRVENLKPPPVLTVSEWADNYRRLSSESSSEPGAWITSRAEYQRGIMDAISDEHVDTVVVMSSAQVGKTEIINNVAGFHIAQDPAPLLVVMPTLEMGEAWSKDRLAPMLRDTPALGGKVKDARARDSGNTLLHKQFPGGHLTVCGANSPSSLASRPIRIVLCDEVDRYPPSAGTEGDPVALAKKRSATFWNRKLILTSTPTLKGVSRIERAYEASDRRKFWVACPHCEESQVLMWSNVKWPPNEPHKATYHCVDCGAAWSDIERWTAVRGGEWRPEGPFQGVAGFWLNELYSPWTRVADMASAFVEAKKSPESLRAFVNTSLGETWEEQGETIDGTGLAERVEEWDLLPAGVLVLTAGVDVQADRLEVEVVGWGRDEESWSLSHVRIFGDPSAAAVWFDLDRVLTQTYSRLDGARLPITAACVDSGYATQAVYSYCSNKFRRRVYAVKGMSSAGRPIWPKKSTKAGGKVNLFTIGVDAAKDATYARLRITRPGPGFCHFPADRDPDWFAQLAAEQVIVKYSKGFPTRVWEKKAGARNEALDCRVYAYAALQSLSVVWSRFKAVVTPPVGDALPPPPAAPRAAVHPSMVAPQSYAPRGRRILSRGI